MTRFRDKKALQVCCACCEAQLSFSPFGFWYIGCPPVCKAGAFPPTSASSLPEFFFARLFANQCRPSNQLLSCRFPQTFSYPYTLRRQKPQIRCQDERFALVNSQGAQENAQRTKFLNTCHTKEIDLQREINKTRENQLAKRHMLEVKRYQADVEGPSVSACVRVGVK